MKRKIALRICAVMLLICFTLEGCAQAGIQEDSAMDTAAPTDAVTSTDTAEPADIPSEAETEGSDFETAQAAVANIDSGWNLGNALDSCGEWIGLYTAGRPSDYETAWGNPVTTPELIAAVKSAGFDAVRVPVTWAEHIDDEGRIDPQWLERVQQVVDMVLEQDMYCILNVHHDGGSDGWVKASTDCYNENSGKFAALWENIALHFRDYDQKLIFEGYNEILDSSISWGSSRTADGYDAANAFNALFVQTVRATGGNNAERNLMVQVYSGSCSQPALDGFVLPADSAEDHLIIQVHNYDPQGFTFSDATWTAMTDTWGSDAEKAYFDQLFASLDAFSKNHDAPVVVGEFGANFKNNEPSRATYAGYFVTAAAQYGIPCFWWDTGDMALFDRSTAAVTRPEVVDALVNIQ